jgi:hypothetical protein
LVVALLGCLALARTGRAEPAKPEVAGQDGTDFIAEARLLSQLVACAGDAELPADWPSPAAQTALCAVARADREVSGALDRAHAAVFGARGSGRSAQVRGLSLRRRRPGDGAGDLSQRRRIHHHFPRNRGRRARVGTLTAKQLKASLDSTLEHLRCLFAVSHSKTTNLKAGSHSSLPGEIAFALVAFPSSTTSRCRCATSAWMRRAR